MTTYENMIAGACAGMSAVLFTYPLDLIRVRLAVNIEKQRAKAITSAFRSIYQREGLLGLFRGIGPTLMVNP
jgi:hypothetical protein